MSFRIEEKIPLTRSDMAICINELQSRGMEPLFEARLIRSVYFDNSSYQIFRDSEEGVLPRKKLRIRNYPNADNEKFSFECKISSIEGRFKSTRAVEKPEMESLFSQGMIDQVYGVCDPVLIVSYIREYFTLQETRITFDSNIHYSDFRSIRHHDEDWCVAEIKAEFGTGAEILNQLITSPRRRFSKYSNGIGAVHDL